MQDYHTEHEKYNQVLWDFLHIKNDSGKFSKKPLKYFNPEDNLEILRWSIHKIMDSAPEGIIIKVVLQFRPGKADFSIQSWHNIQDPQNGFTSIATTHKTEVGSIYNACVEYILNIK